MKIRLTEKEISIIKNEIRVTIFDNQEISNKINFLRNSTKYQKYNPTYEQAIEFIRNDSTNNNSYLYDKYNCVYFSKDVNNNAEKQNISCAYLRLNLKGNEPHALVAFNTTDKGIIFIEPQTDEIVNLQIGKDYWAECLTSSFENYKSNEKNIIVSYILYW